MTVVMRDTGFPRADAENDFLRARRRQFRAALARRLRGRPADGGRLLPLDEIVGPLGWRGQRQVGLQTIRLDTIAGTAGGRLHFVNDGHHRVSIAAATGQQQIDAYVTQVLTTAPPPARTASPARCWR
jgi:hypothetical protein